MYQDWLGRHLKGLENVKFPRLFLIERVIYICDEPEIVGATGAAVYALEKYRSR